MAAVELHVVGGTIGVAVSDDVLAGGERLADVPGVPRQTWQILAAVDAHFVGAVGSVYSLNAVVDGYCVWPVPGAVH